MSELDLVTGDVRSPAGHAAFSMRGTDDRWVLIQVNTFKNWINEQLRYCDMTVDDVQTDFCDGIKLCAMMENLQNKRVGRVVKKPHNQHQYLENVSLALRAMVNDGIKLVNIGGEDIVNGNLKLILGMLWRLILRYQIGKSKVPPKKLMLAWIKAVIPDLDITNFNSDWNDGIALHALVEYCKPGTCPNWRQLSRRDGLQNCRNAMDLAKQHFDIPLVLSPENLSSPDLDELSGMTYLSYFMKVDSPGFNATLNWVREQIPASRVDNFQTDWNDGKVVAALTQTLGGSVPGWPGILDTQAPTDIIQNSMNAAQQIGVSPVISAREMADTEVDHLGVMAYAAWFQHAAVRSPQPVITPPLSVPLMAAPPPRPPTPPVEIIQKTPPTEAIDVRVPVNQVQMNKQTSFLMELLDEDVDKRQVRAEVIGPSSKPSVTVTWAGEKGHAEFVPLESGTHQVLVYNEGEVVKGCPIPVNVSYDLSQVQLAAPISNTGLVGIALPIQISAADARRGAVKVEARAPSGRLHDMGVIENNGVFTANFTPTEVGDWLISILYDGQHIQGSPFNVRVYDAEKVRVYGLEGGAVGKTFSFSVDTAGAGEGQLSVEIQHNGRTIPPQVHPDGPNKYRVSFTPEGGGIYTIRVHFAGMEVKGSPYTLEIVDSSQVTASGDGISSVEVNRRATFIVSTGHLGSSGDIRCTVTSPRGMQIPCQIINNGDGTHRVEYMPNEVGEYVVDVFYYGKPIQGSPFKVHAFDWNRISIKNLKSSGIVGRLVEFDIDAGNAGSGNLEIMVNDGTIPCSVQNRGNRQFHASFMPKEAIPHQIQMRFNGREVPGSPWNLDMRTASHVTASGQGLQLISTNRIATFDVRTGQAEGDVTAVIQSPTHRPVPLRVVNNHNGTHTVEYTPTEVGNYAIEVAYEGLAIPSSPFSSKAYDAHAIIVSPIPTGIVSKPIEFTVDVTQAGEGQLEIMVNRGAVPNSVRMMSKGVFHVSFVPRDSRPHMIDIKFNGEPIPRTPITVPIMDASRVTVQGDGLRQVAVNKQSYFSVNTQSAGEADLSVRVTSPNGELVPAKIVMQPDGDYKVEYSSKYTGRHTVEILYAGQAIMGSPFYVEIYDPNKIQVEGTRGGMIGQKVTFDIIRNEAGRAELGLTITSPSGRTVPYQIDSIPLGDRVSYVPTEHGPHQIYITYGGLDVPGCPIRQDIVDSGTASAYGDGLQRGEEDKPATFYVDSGGRQGDLDVSVDGPNSIAKCHVEPEHGGKYLVTYVPVEVGVYNVRIRWNGRDIAGSPYKPHVVDARKVRPIGGWESLIDSNNKMMLKLNEMKYIEFDTRDAGPGKMTAEIRGPEAHVHCDVVDRGSSHIVSFTPRIEGEYFVKVFWNDAMVPRCPIIGVVRDGMVMVVGDINHEKVVLTGHGLREARVREETEFVIDGTDAGPGVPDVKLSGVKTDIEVRCVSIGGNKYRCTYVPQIAGAYLLNIMWSDRQVRGSPFKVNVTASSDASKVQVSGEGIKCGVMGRDIKSTIDTRRAGPGELTAHCMGPNKVAYCELYDHHDGTFTLNVKPQEPGRHTLQVKYGGEHVPGSPFTLRISGAPDASKVRVSGPGIEHGILATYQSSFIVETRGAGAGQLTVRIRGPKGAFRVEMQRESQKDRAILCRYDPAEVGDYIIHVKWSGEHVPGSPFHVQIFDTQQELERFLAENPQRRTNAISMNTMSNGSTRSWAEDF